MNDRFWTRFFAFAGIVNLLAGGTWLLWPDLTASSPLALPLGNWLFVRMAGACVASFGVGYLMAAADLDRNRGVITIGAIGKSLVFAIFLIYWIKGTIGFGAFALGAVDLAFVLFFVRFLTRYAAR